MNGLNLQAAYDAAMAAALGHGQIAPVLFEGRRMLLWKPLPAAAEAT